jgi:hypothetical protein
LVCIFWRYVFSLLISAFPHHHTFCIGRSFLKGMSIFPFFRCSRYGFFEGTFFCPLISASFHHPTFCIGRSIYFSSVRFFFVFWVIFTSYVFLSSCELFPNSSRPGMFFYHVHIIFHGYSFLSSGIFFLLVLCGWFPQVGSFCFRNLISYMNGQSRSAQYFLTSRYVLWSEFHHPSFLSTCSYICR